MTTAADIMHRDVEWVPASASLVTVARMMRDLNVGALPVADENQRMCGIITDRDIVLMCVAAGRHPDQATAGDLAQGTPRWIQSNADVDDVLHEMEDHELRHLPVIDANRQLVGMITEADLATNLTDEELGQWTKKIFHDNQPPQRNAGAGDMPGLGSQTGSPTPDDE